MIPEGRARCPSAPGERDATGPRSKMSADGADFRFSAPAAARGDDADYGIEDDDEDDDEDEDDTTEKHRIGELTSRAPWGINRAFYETNRSDAMSVHSSLKSKAQITAKRNVMKRFERIDLLQARGKWKKGDRALGLPKTKPAL